MIVEVEVNKQEKYIFGVNNRYYYSNNLPSSLGMHRLAPASHLLRLSCRLRNHLTDPGVLAYPPRSRHRELVE